MRLKGRTKYQIGLVSIVCGRNRYIYIKCGKIMLVFYDLLEWETKTKNTQIGKIAQFEVFKRKLYLQSKSNEKHDNEMARVKSINDF